MTDYPFTTDGCSGGIYRKIFRRDPPWLGCCTEHDKLYWQGGTRVMFGKWNGTPIDPPEFDPKGEYFIMRAPVYNERGAKLPVPVEGRTHMPVFDDIAAIIIDDDDMATRAAMDLPKARFAK